MTNMIRKNVAKISKDERDRLRDAFIGIGRKEFSDKVSYWRKQDEIHERFQHGKPSFLPWHRELCNRLEALLREVDPKVSLHYWDFTTDPRASDNGSGGTTNLFTDDFMGNADGDVGTPFLSLRGPIIKRKVDPGPPLPNRVKSDEEIIRNGDMESKENQWKKFRFSKRAFHLGY